MRNICDIKFSVFPSSDISDVVSDAIELAKKHKTSVRFKFNGVSIKISDLSNWQDAIEYYHLALKYQG